MHDTACYCFVHAHLIEHYGKTQQSYLFPWKHELLGLALRILQQDAYCQNRVTEAPDQVSGRYLCYGHTHIPTLCSLIHTEQVSHGVQLRSIYYNTIQPLGSGMVAVNPGSVGQPGDGDPRASYAILDTTACTIEFRRVAYDVERVLAAMRDASYPEPLISRLQDAGTHASHSHLNHVYDRSTTGLIARPALMV
jgi:diadenosine tetraphosphatase ApaH/serine/threonine PP2A family protein phosphatase